MRSQTQGAPEKRCKIEGWSEGGWVGWKKPPFAAVPLVDVSFYVLLCSPLWGEGSSRPWYKKSALLKHNFSSPGRFDFVYNPGGGGGEAGPLGLSPRSATKGLHVFTWRWGTPGKWGNQLRWGNPLVHYLLSWSPHLSCKCDQIKMRDYMDRQVTLSKWVSSPPWGPSHSM